MSRKCVHLPAALRPMQTGWRGNEACAPRMQALLSQQRPLSPQQHDACLQHVLLWQYLKRRNVMQLVEVALSLRSQAYSSPGQSGPRRGQRRQRAGSASNFLVALGVPLVLDALAQVCHPQTTTTLEVQTDVMRCHHCACWPLRLSQGVGGCRRTAA